MRCCWNPKRCEISFVGKIRVRQAFDNWTKQTQIVSENYSCIRFLKLSTFCFTRFGWEMKNLIESISTRRVSGQERGNEKRSNGEISSPPQARRRVSMSTQPNINLVAPSGVTEEKGKHKKIFIEGKFIDETNSWKCSLDFSEDFLVGSFEEIFHLWSVKDTGFFYETLQKYVKHLWTCDEHSINLWLSF